MQLTIQYPVYSHLTRDNIEKLYFNNFQALRIPISTSFTHSLHIQASPQVGHKQTVLGLAVGIQNVGTLKWQILKGNTTLKNTKYRSQNKLIQMHQNWNSYK
jgi:hypothetical protein